MPLSTGTRIGPFEILSLLGAGGMGEVYRASDSRLRREVAIKFLRAETSSDPERMRRFEQEARAAGALNHPNVVAVHDVGTHEGAPYLVTELLEGATLRERLRSSGFTVREAVDCAIQIARGLFAAHEKGIVHRDLKPENVFLTKAGGVKILDFGLAKLRGERRSPGTDEDSPTATASTDAGTLLGTATYMSPEQVRASLVDHRSDIFSLGTLLFELLSRRRPFAGETTAETLTAILKQDPPDLSSLAPATPPALERIVRRCLEKIPEQRFHSAHDLALALEAVSGGASTSVPVPAPRPRFRSNRIAAGVLLGLGLGAWGAYALRHRQALLPSAASSALSFQRLTFREGLVGRGRFAPDGQTIFYDARWRDRQSEIFFARAGNPEGRSLGLQDVQLFSVSSQGELALLLRASSYEDYTLATMPFPGGTPREISLEMRDADWSPDGKDLAVNRWSKRIEHPLGKVLYDSNASVALPRFSPNGTRIAFLESNRYTDSIWVTDRAGGKKRLVENPNGITGLAWSPGGEEVWFGSYDAEDLGAVSAVDLSGRVRPILPLGDTWVEVCDLARNGDLLLLKGSFTRGLISVARGEERPRELSWLSNSLVSDIADDGKAIVFTEGDAASAVYLRTTDGADAVRLGSGSRGSARLSPDGKWVLALQGGSIVLYPVGPGQSRALSTGALRVDGANWFPDAKRILLFAGARDHSRLYTLEVEGGEAQPVSGENVHFDSPRAISPDGKAVLVIGPPNVDLYQLYSLESRSLHGIGLVEGEYPIRWSPDGRYVYYTIYPDHRRVYRLELRTRRKEPWKEIPLPLSTDTLAGWPAFTADGLSYAFSYSRYRRDLYLVKGLR